MTITRHLPNFLTSLNLTAGFLAIIAAFNYSLVASSFLIIIAIILDFADGFTAKILKAKTLTGKELDSLADVVSFGIAPGSMMYLMLCTSNSMPSFTISDIMILPFISILIPVLSALRLARFNLDREQEDIFKGLPTPANALLFASLPLITRLQLDREIFIHTLLTGLLNNFYFLLFLILCSSCLMVSRISMISFKFSNFTWRCNKERYLLSGLSVILLLIFHYIAIPIIIFLYILFSIINNPKNEIQSRD